MYTIDRETPLDVPRFLLQGNFAMFRAAYGRLILNETMNVHLTQLTYQKEHLDTTTDQRTYPAGSMHTTQYIPASCQTGYPHKC